MKEDFNWRIYNVDKLGSYTVALCKYISSINAAPGYVRDGDRSEVSIYIRREFTYVGVETSVTFQFRRYRRIARVGSNRRLRRIFDK